MLTMMTEGTACVLSPSLSLSPSVFISSLIHRCCAAVWYWEHLDLQCSTAEEESGRVRLKCWHPAENLQVCQTPQSLSISHTLWIRYYNKIVMPPELCPCLCGIDETGTLSTHGWNWTMWSWLTSPPTAPTSLGSLTQPSKEEQTSMISL